MELEERLGFIEFRMDLLREGSEFSKYIYDCGVTRSQLTELYDVMDYFRAKYDNGEEFSSAEYENKILSIVDNRTHDYHFCEIFAKLLWEENRYEELFPALYSNLPKYQYLFE